MKDLVLYIHGKGGCAGESEHYKQLFPDCEVVGLDYQTFTPWETGKEIREAVIKLNAKYDSIVLVANSIGAFFSMNAGIDEMIRCAYFISPVVDMEQVILNMMSWANVTETELEEKGVIPTSFGEDLSWDYLCYVREHPVCWTVPTRILYGSRDNLTSHETISAFAETHSAELTVMEEGEHWFHTDGQMRFLDNWIINGREHTMKILVLNGSPKRDKSDTMHITRAFLDGMKEAASQDVHIIHTIDQHIEYCTGCFSCMRNGGNCIHDDDMRPILDEILDSDLLVLSFPLYCYGMPASLKALMDRTLPLSNMAMQKVGERYEHVGQADFSHLKYLMICGCGFPNSRQNFEPAVMQFKLCFPCDHTIITVPESPMFNAPEAAVVTVPRLELIKQAGRQYAEKGEIEASLLAEITSPMIPEDQYAAIVNGSV